MLRPDLELLVMSATLDPEPVCRLLGEDTHVVSCEGRMFPVETKYVARPAAVELESWTARAILRALNEGQGDVLVFPSRAREIHRTERELLQSSLPPQVAIHTLYGSMSAEAG